MRGPRASSWLAMRLPFRCCTRRSRRNWSPSFPSRYLSLDIRAPRDEVHGEITPLLAQIEEDESHGVADRLIEEVRRQGLGVVGPQETRDALTHGQVDTLVLADGDTLGCAGA